MNRPSHFARAAALALAAACLGAMPTTAQDVMAGALKISTPWTRVPPQASTVAGAFLSITNTGQQPDRLVGGTVLAAARIEVHEMTLDGGIMKMRELKAGLEIKPGETVVLRPGSFHLMFMDLKAPLKAGESVKGTLVFEKAGTVQVAYSVQPMGAKAYDHGGGAAHGK